MVMQLVNQPQYTFNQRMTMVIIITNEYGDHIYHLKLIIIANRTLIHFWIKSEAIDYHEQDQIEIWTQTAQVTVLQFERYQDDETSSFSDQLFIRSDGS